MISTPSLKQDRRSSTPLNSRCPPPEDVHTPNGPIICNSRLPNEVLYIIFALLHNSPKDGAAAALVCRHWSEAALDELWRSLPSVLPLLELLGSISCLNELAVNPGPRTLQTAQAWDRFSSYAPRVREIVFDDDSSPFDRDVLSSLIGHLVEAHPRETVLPNLQNLCWKTDDQRTLDYVLSFCPPTLERISLIIRGWDVPKVLVEQLLRSLSTLPNVFKAFELDIRIFDSETATMAVALETFIRSQPGLLELRLPRYPIQDHASVLAACRTAPQLHTFSERTTCPTKEEYREALGTIAKECPSLRHLMLNRWCNRLDDVVDAADLEPLLDCPFLEHITLWFNAGLELDDQGIRRMGGVWTSLETLVLQTEGFKTTPMSCLVAFAESFPALRRLESPFDRSRGLPSMNEVTARFRSLRQLVLIGDWIQVDEMPSVAEFLARVCNPEVQVNISLLCIPYYDTSLEEEMISNKGGSDDQTKAIRHWMGIFHRAQEGLGRSE